MNALTMLEWPIDPEEAFPIELHNITLLQFSNVTIAQRLRLELRLWRQYILQLTMLK